MDGVGPEAVLEQLRPHLASCFHVQRSVLWGVLGSCAGATGSRARCPGCQCSFRVLCLQVAGILWLWRLGCPEGLGVGFTVAQTAGGGCWLCGASGGRGTPLRAARPGGKICCCLTQRGGGGGWLRAWDLRCAWTPQRAPRTSHRLRGAGRRGLLQGTTCFPLRTPKMSRAT